MKMKQPVLADRSGNSSYFSAPELPKFDDDSDSSKDVSWKMRFPNSKRDIWNDAPCGDSIVFGIRHYHPVTLLCLKRCLRLAHRHASQKLLDSDGENDTFQGFLMGTTMNMEDERGVLIDFDRFDPGTVRSEGNKTPSTPLPGDLVVPVFLKKGLPQSSDYTNVFKPHDYDDVLKLLHHQVSSGLAVENTCLFPVRLQVFYAKDGPQYDEVDMELQWVSPCISNSLRAIPINPVPIIPTALAKNLSGPLDVSSLHSSSKTGYLSMNKSRKLLLLLDTDPKSRAIPTVGIWISGVVSIHSPVVWLACMRYLHSPNLYERVMVDGQFLVVLYSVMSRDPLFFQVKSDDNEKLNFDLLYSKEFIQVCKQSTGESESALEFRLDLTSSSMPQGGLMERDVFDEAIKRLPPFLAPKRQPVVNENQEKKDPEIAPQRRGRQPKKNSGIPQSILRKNSSGRKSSGSRTRSSSNGVSFSLAVDDSEIFTDATPMPLPSPHPATIHQSQTSVKPSVPELSIIFDENYPNIGHGNQQRQPSLSPTKRRSMANKVHGISPGIRSPLKNIKNLNPHSRGVPVPDQRIGPMKPHANQYFQQPIPDFRGPVRNVPYYQNDYQPVQIQRRSHSASDCVRGPGGRNTVPIALQRPIMSQQNMYHPARRTEQMNSREPLPGPYPYPQGSQKMMQGHPRVSSPSVNGNYIPQNHQFMNFQQNQFPVMNKFSDQEIRNPSHFVYQPNLTSNSNAPHESTTNPMMAPSQTTPIPVSTPTVSLPSSQPLSVPPQSHQIPTTSVVAQSPVAPAVMGPSESPGWMKQLPPEAYQLLMQQDAQLKMLQAQIQKLLAVQENNANQMKQKSAPSTTEMSTSTETEPESTVSEAVSMGTNTGASLYIPNSSGNVDEENCSSNNEVTTPGETTPASKVMVTQSTSPILQPNFSDDTSQASNAATPKEGNSIRCDSRSTDKYAASDFASIHLDETNLREIATANNEDDIDSNSLASSLKVDIPALESSTEQSSFDTPARRISACDMWNAQDSPVLGESASMCVVPPINLNKSLREAENDDAEECEGSSKMKSSEEPKDEDFMKNLLNQVRDMLKKADIAGGSELSAENSAASTPHRTSKKKNKKSSRSSDVDRVTVATKKQLRKMGVNLDEDAVNVISSAVVASDKKANAEKFTYALPEPLIPRLNYMSFFMASSSSENIGPTPSATDLSMHANAIALKYLSNEQLEEIAALSKVGKSSADVFSPAKSKNGSSGSEAKPSVYDIFSADSKKTNDKRLSGMSLVSPCNMSLATRKYMEKYGLIDGTDSSDSDEEDEENQGPKVENKVERPQVNQTQYTPDAGENPTLKEIPSTQPHNHRGNTSAEKNQNMEGYPEFPQAEQGFSELKMNLGDTLDMILPFLDDLGRHRQQTPSSGTNGRDSRSGTRSSQTGSSRDRLTSVSDRVANQPETHARRAEEHIPSHGQYFAAREEKRQRNNSEDKASGRNVHQKTQKMKNHLENEVSQILSPEILKAVAESKKLARTPGGSTRTEFENPPFSHRDPDPRREEEHEQDFLAGTWPRHQFRTNSEFSRQWSRESSRRSHQRRLSSSPSYPVAQKSSGNCHNHGKSRTSPPSSSKSKKLRDVHDRSSKQLEDVKEVEWISSEPSQGRHCDDCNGEEGPILTSRVTDAFREKEEETNKNKNEQRNTRPDNEPHFLEHLQTKNTDSEENKDNFLDMNRIRNLPKLS